jgi:hypothetical protein
MHPRMRKRARTDLCGGRSVMVVPTATAIVVKSSSVLAQPVNPNIRELFQLGPVSERSRGFDLGQEFEARP